MSSTFLQQHHADVCNKILANLEVIKSLLDRSTALERIANDIDKNGVRNNNILKLKYEIEDVGKSLKNLITQTGSIIASYDSFAREKVKSM